MKIHSDGYKRQIKLIGKEIDSKITYGNTVLGKDDLNAVTPNYQGGILTSVMKQLDIDSNVEIPVGTILKYEFGVKVNGVYEYINYGNYIVHSVEKQEDTHSYLITCYDKMLYAMVDYKKDGITYPTTIRNYLRAICNKLGLTFANEIQEFANYDKVIETDLYDGLDYTYRDVLDDIAQVTASTICINNDDEVEVRYINDTVDTIDEEFLKDVNVNFGKKYGPINSIVLSRSAESDNVYLQDEESVAQNGLTELKIIDNQIMNFNNRVDYLPEILGKLNGLEYYINDFTSTGITYYDLCDRYNVKIGDNIYSCIMFNNEVNVTQGLQELVYTEMPKETETDYKKADKTDRKINQTYIIVDKQNQTINALASDVSGNTQKITNLQITTSNISSQITNLQETTNTQTEQINSLELTATSTTSKISNIEKDLSTTNQNLSDLEKEIQGVSVDFENFKDTEYAETIQNIQDQLDGAIQFWSGTEIPTLNNFPANEWTTEALKNEHQGDIYDVLEGETIVSSYKFIKIDGVYEWRIMSDSEISAVKQLAQEALNKANQNKNDIEVINGSVTELQQTDKEIKTSVSEIKTEVVPTGQASGSNIHITDSADAELLDFKLYGKSTQDTEPTPNAPVEIESVGTYNETTGKYEVEVNINNENLFNYEDTTSVTGGITTDENGWITITYDNTNGTSTKYFNYYTNPSSVLKTNTNYKLITEIKEVSGTGILFSASSTATSQINNGTSYSLDTLNTNDIKIATFTTKSDFSSCTNMIRTYIQFRAGESGSITFRISVLADTPIIADNFIYKPYGITTTLIELDEPLKGLTAQDYLYLQNSNLYLKKNIGEVVLNGSENWNFVSNSYFQFGFNLGIAWTSTSTTVAPQGKCNRYICKSRYYVINATAGIDKSISMSASYIAIRDSNFTNLEEFKTWLSENNVKVQYELAEPEDILIAENVDSLITYKNVTNISTTDNLQPNMEIVYVKDNTLNDIYQTQNGMNKYYTKVENDAQLEIVSDEIKSSVTEINTTIDTIRGAIETINQTMLTQTADQFEMLFKQTGIKELVDSVDALTKSNNATLVEQEQWIRFKGGNIELGRSDSQVKLLLSNDRISFLTGGNESAYISNNQLYITDSTILNKLQVGHWETIEENGNLNTRWIEGVI